MKFRLVHCLNLSIKQLVPPCMHIAQHARSCGRDCKTFLRYVQMRRILLRDILAPSGRAGAPIVAYAKTRSVSMFVIASAKTGRENTQVGLSSWLAQLTKFM